MGGGGSQAGVGRAGVASGWSLADAVLLGKAVASWVVGHRGGDGAPTREALLLAHKNVEVATTITTAVFNRPIVLIEGHLPNTKTRHVTSH